jgi:hypothetical protein
MYSHMLPGDWSVGPVLVSGNVNISISNVNISLKVQILVNGHLQCYRQSEVGKI